MNEDKAKAWAALGMNEETFKGMYESYVRADIAATSAERLADDAYSRKLRQAADTMIQQYEWMKELAPEEIRRAALVWEDKPPGL